MWKALYIFSLLVERISQKMREIFARHGFGLKIEANLQVTDFLDVLLDLKQGTHRAWVKPEQIIHFVKWESNHPAHMSRNGYDMLDG